ncbi:MAG: S-layer homology domain-containing protein, partial [Eubacteriales bacterium]
MKNKMTFKKTRSQTALTLAGLMLALPLHTQASGFADVDDGHWGKDFVTTTVGAGLMIGAGENNFDPGGIMTYGEFAVVVVNGTFGGAYDTEGTINHWSDAFLNVLIEHGLFLTSTGQSVVEMNDGWQGTSITREDVATVVARLMDGGDFLTGDASLLDGYNDIPSTGELATTGQLQDMLDVIANKVMVGSNGAFGTGETFQRVEGCVVFKKLLEFEIIEPVNGTEEDDVVVEEETTEDTTVEEETTEDTTVEEDTTEDTTVEDTTEDTTVEDTTEDTTVEDTTED